MITSCKGVPYQKVRPPAVVVFYPSCEKIIVMSLAATHILVPIIFFEYLRDCVPAVRRFFSRKYVFLIGIAGIMPDMDLPVFTAINILSGKVPSEALGHRFLLHNIWIPLSFLLFFIVFYAQGRRIGLHERKRSKGKRPRENSRRTSDQKDRDSAMVFSKIFLVLALGWLFHLALDAVMTGSIMPFYPINDYIIDIDLTGRLSSLTGINALTISVSIDALLLIFWLWHEHFTHKIVDYF
jgi:membrane-bound metal-dependent hydrolase YbcI (DUF457 family)